MSHELRDGVWNDRIKIVTITIVALAGLALLLPSGSSEARRFAPDVGASLRNAESIAAKHARLVQWKLADQVGGDQWAEGRLRYDEVKGLYESTTAYLATALIDGFTVERMEETRKRLRRAEVQLDDFVGWCGPSPKSNVVEAFPFDLAKVTADKLMDLVRWTSDVERSKVEALVSEIKECRWKTWDELHRERIGEVPPADAPPAPSPRSSRGKA